MSQEDLKKTEWVKTVLEDILWNMKGYNNGGLKDEDEETKNTNRSCSLPNPTMTPPHSITEVGVGGNGEGNRSHFKILALKPPSSSVDDGASYASSGSDDNGSPTEIVVGLHGSNSNPKLTINGSEGRTSQESLIPDEGQEGWRSIALQVAIPLFFAGLGMVFAGYILDIVKDWDVFRGVPELLVMVTPLLGLKGNLEMTLASRLSTHSNLGNLETLSKQWHLCSGNLILIQVQANVVGFLTSVMAVGLGFALNGIFVSDHALLLCASSMLTASVASWVLGVLMTSVVILAERFHCNPDNIAIPVAGSFGDITTLGFLAYFSSHLYDLRLTIPWLSPCIIIGCSLVLPFWIYIANKNTYTKDILRTGWLPVIVAMIFSCFGGVVLDLAEGLYPRMGLFQPVINGVGGNLVSVQSSRISTSLHKYCELGKLPRAVCDKEASLDKGEVTAGVWLSPWSVFTKQGVHSTSALLLLGMVIPGQAIFFMMLFALSGDKDVSQLSVGFFVAYLLAATIQVMILLYIVQVLIHWFWVNKIDPDTSTIPYLTALGDLIGTGFLFLAFHILYGQ